VGKDVIENRYREVENLIHLHKSRTFRAIFTLSCALGSSRLVKQDVGDLLVQYV